MLGIPETWCLSRITGELLLNLKAKLLLSGIFLFGSTFELVVGWWRLGRGEWDPPSKNASLRKLYQFSKMWPIYDGSPLTSAIQRLIFGFGEHVWTHLIQSTIVEEHLWRLSEVNLSIFQQRESANKRTNNKIKFFTPSKQLWSLNGIFIRFSVFPGYEHVWVAPPWLTQFLPFCCFLCIKNSFDILFFGSTTRKGRIPSKNISIPLGVQR